MRQYLVPIVIIAIIFSIIVSIGLLGPATLIGADDSDEALLVYDGGTPYYVANLQTHIAMTNTQYEENEVPTLLEADLVLVNSGSAHTYATNWVVAIESYDFIWERNGQIINQVNWMPQGTPMGSYDLTLPLATGNEQFPNPGELVITDHIEVTLALKLSISANEGSKPSTEFYTAHFGAEIVGNQIPTCTASANPTSGYVPLDVAFTSTSNDPDGVIVSYEWDFGDGTPVVNNRESTTHTYTELGVYIAKFTVTDDQGATASDSVQIAVSAFGQNLPPSCIASANPTSGDKPLTVQFSGESFDPDGSIVSQEWDFGDGSTATSATPSHEYKIVGTFTAIYTVTDNEGTTASASVSIEVTEELGGDVDDADSDGLPDIWEMQFFGNLFQDAEDDYDNDNYTNLEEFEALTDPTDPGDYPSEDINWGFWVALIIFIIGILIGTFILFKTGSFSIFIIVIVVAGSIAIAIFYIVSDGLLAVI